MVNPDEVTCPVFLLNVFGTLEIVFILRDLAADIC